MTDEQKAAYVNAQTALMLVELEAMKSENQARAFTNAAPAYPEIAFHTLQEKYGFLQHNALYGFFQQ